MKPQTLPFLLAIVCLLLFDNCKKEQSKSSLKDIKAFIFQMAANPSLKADVAATIDQTTDTISIGLPQGTNLTSLIRQHEELCCRSQSPFKCKSHHLLRLFSREQFTAQQQCQRDHHQ